MLDLINSVLNPLLNSRSKNWIEATNSAEHSWQQHVERKNISTVQLFISDPIGLGLARHGSICIRIFCSYPCRHSFLPRIRNNKRYDFREVF